VPDLAPKPLLSIPAAMAQLRYVWPGLMRRRQVRHDVEIALAQVDEQFVRDFREAHPRARHAIIYRVGRHELQVRDLHREDGDLSVHWVDHPRLVGAGIAWGEFALAIAQQRYEAERARARELAAV
jgi:hypothetical protein